MDCGLSVWDVTRGWLIAVLVAMTVLGPAALFWLMVLWTWYKKRAKGTSDKEATG